MSNDTLIPSIIVASGPIILGLAQLWGQRAQAVRAGRIAEKAEAAREALKQTLVAHTERIKDVVAAQSSTIDRIEIHTNSMKDALVSATATAARAQGVIDEKARSEQAAAAFKAGEEKAAAAKATG